MSENTPRVSIITPVHNASAFLLETIRSAQAQTLEDWEMLAVDDHSTDNSLDLLRIEAASDPRIKVFTSPLRGAAEARNLALRQAKGDFIAFLDADDLWLPEKLSHQISFMENQGVDFSYTPYDYIDEHSRPMNIRREVPSRINYRSSRRGCRIGCLTVVYRRSAAPSVQTVALAKRNDDALWLRCFKSIEEGYRLNEPLALYRKSAGSLSSGSKFKLLKHHYALYRKNEGLDPLRSVFYTVCNVIVYFDVNKRWEHSIP